MAIGDLTGDLTSTYDAKRRQTSFDMSNYPVGPVGRASQQLSSLPAVPKAAAPSLSMIPVGGAAGATALPVVQSVVAAQPAPSLSGVGVSAPRQAGITQPASLNNIPTISTDNPFRGTGIGGGAAGGNIVARNDANGVPEFTNAPGAQQQAASLSNFSPMRRGSGSLGTIGDGTGTFSQAQQGDSALASQRFNRASEIRQDTRNQQRLDRALANQSSLDNFTVVPDSSRRLTRDDLIRDQLSQQERANGLESIAVAQGMISGTQSQRAGGQQLRQAARLEDIQARAYSPTATQQDRDVLAAIADPTGRERAAVDLSVAKADQARAAAEKDRREGGAGNIKLTEGQSKDLQYHDRANASNAELATNGGALTSAGDAFIRSIPLVGGSAIGNSLVSNERQTAEQSGREFVNAILRKDSGAALTDNEIKVYGQTYLPQPGDGAAVLKQKEEARSRAVEGIRKGLGTAQILATATIKPDEARQAAAGSRAQTNATPGAIPTAMTKAEADALPPGTVFIGPNGRQYRK